MYLVEEFRYMSQARLTLKLNNVFFLSPGKSLDMKLLLLGKGALEKNGSPLQWCAYLWSAFT